MFSRVSAALRRATQNTTVQGITAGATAASVLAGGVALASDTHHLPRYPWNHSGYFSALDSAAIRRGFEVYRQVCSSCHSLQYRCYRHLVGVSHTEEQAKALAASIEVKDGPNDAGEMFMRPGKLFDPFPSPYANEEMARSMNNGAAPPDLSLMVLARPGGEDYVMALLNGYQEPPAGLTLREGLHYNVYFPGNAISMQKPLNDGAVDFEDGTPATVTQMAKDVVTFLTWTASPELDERKKDGMKILVALTFAAALAGYQKRLTWAIHKTARIRYVNSPGQHFD